ncbi:MAG: hypothetical protein IVW56_09430 [Candidatus Binataceae bacterium]|nr:hypothetical protein [Candidatus Binataceae bacterium]
MSGFWLKLKHGAPANPKWRAVAAKAGCPAGHVWALYSWALDFAGQHDGSLAGFDLEEVAAGTDYPLDLLRRIWDVFIEKAIVVGTTLRNWAQHQGAGAVKAGYAAAQAAVRSVAKSTERVRAHRARPRQLSMMLPIDGSQHPETRSAPDNDETFRVGVSCVSSSVSSAENAHDINDETRPLLDKRRVDISLRSNRAREVENNLGEEGQHAPTPLSPPGFAEWWAAWPHKVARPAAAQAYRRAIARGATPAALLAGAARYIATKPADRQWCNPARWLTEDRWLDQPGEVNVRTANGGAGISSYRAPDAPPPTVECRAYY